MRDGFVLVANASTDLPSTLRAALATTTYALLHAKDGEEAVGYLDLLRTGIYLAIIDLELPLINGLDVIWRLVKERKPTKIIATSWLAVPLLEQPLQEFGVAVVRHPTPAAIWRNILAMALNGPQGGCTDYSKMQALTIMAHAAPQTKELPIIWKNTPKRWADVAKRCSAPE